MRRKVVSSFLLATVFFVAACVSTPSISSSPSGCINPVVGFSYPIKSPDSQQVRGITVPQGEWELETEAPPAAEAAIAFTRMAFARPVDGNMEVWLLRWTRNVSDQPQFLVYQPATQNWEVIETPYPAGIDADAVETILIDEDQAIWAVSWSQSSIQLLKFDDSKRVFEVSAENYMLKDIRSEFPLSDSPKVFFNKGTLWTAYDNQLYSFDVSSGVVEQYELRLQDAVIANNNNAVHFSVEPITIQDDVMAFGSEQRIYLLSANSPELLEYHPQNGELIRKIIPVITQDIGLESSNYFDNPPTPGAVNGDNLFVDRSGNLWVNDFGWMEPDGTWNIVLRSPVFIGEQIEVMKYLWYRPEIILQTTDDMLWFRSPNGLVELNAQEGLWCWITQSISNIGEDSDRNLWMIADGKLYKNPLGQ